MRLCFVPLCCALVAASLPGQEPVPAEAAEAVAAVLEPHPDERSLGCAIEPLAPVLTFRLIYRTGYSITAPMQEFLEEPRALNIVTRVTPKRAGARPVLLKDTEALPAEAKEQQDAAKFDAQVTGGFYVGEGDYHVELAVTGSGGRVCRKQWDVEVKAHKGASTALAAGQAAAVSQIELPRVGGGDGSLTIFLLAGSGRENPVLLESVAGILDRMPFRRVQVVAVSLDQHKELLREDVAGGADIRRLAEALNGYNPAVVSYGVLQDPAGHRDFLWKLLAKEGLRTPPDDLVVFAGHSTFDDSHVFVPPACADRSHSPHYIYLDYAVPGRRRARPAGPGPGRRMRGMPRADVGGVRPGPWPDVPDAATMQPVLPDVVSRVTRACAGKVFPIYSPADLASALQKTEEVLARR